MRLWMLPLGLLVGCSDPEPCADGFERGADGYCELPQRFVPDPPDPPTEDSACPPLLEHPEDFAGLVGQARLTTEINGVPACDRTVALLGTPYTGDCPSCEFAFDIDTTVTDDAGVDCDFWPLFMFEAVSPYSDTWMAYSNCYYGAGAQMLGFEVTYAYSGSSTYGPFGPYWYAFPYMLGSATTFVRTGDEIAWTVSLDTYSYTYGSTTGSTYLYGSTCAEYGYGLGGIPITPQYGSAGDVPCDTGAADVWTLTPPAGTDVAVAVDTVSASTTFDPALWVNDVANGRCLKGFGDDNFDCTEPPPSFSCPAVRFAAEGGVYEVVVYSEGQCADALAEYAIGVEATADPSLTLQADDIELSPYTFGTSYVHVEIDGTATLQRP